MNKKHVPQKKTTFNMSGEPTSEMFTDILKKPETIPLCLAWVEKTIKGTVKLRVASAMPEEDQKLSDEIYALLADALFKHSI